MNNSLRIGPRSNLEVGRKFRATGGPRFKLSDGSEISIAARGPFTFRGAEVDGNRIYIHASDRGGSHCVLHIAGERRAPAGVIPVPYRIKSIKRRSKR